MPEVFRGDGGPVSSGPDVDVAGEAARIFAGGGEMGRLCRAMDWSSTALGPLEEWPQSLKTAAGMVIAQGIAQSLCWGPELVQVYNDAYRVIMRDKHPAGLGRPVLLNWSEVAHDIGPLFERVQQGETVYFEDLPLRVERHGAIEDAFFTFSYSPVRVESGAIGGVLINCFETTQQVHVRGLQVERDRLFDSLHFERSRLEYVFQHTPAFLAILRGREHVFELVNEAYYQLVGHRDILGRGVVDALPEIRDQGFVEILDDVLETGEPFLGSEVPVLIARRPGAPPEQVYIDLAYLPLVEEDGTRSGIVAHGYEVTEQVLARRQVEQLLTASEQARVALEEVNRQLATKQEELESANRQLQETREHLYRIIVQAPVAMYIALGREHVFDVANASYYAMVGKTPEDMLGRPGREVFPELAEQGIFEIIEDVYDTGVPYTASAIPAALDTDGDGVPETHYFNLVYQPLLGADGSVYAIALVATEVTQLVQAREAAEAAQQEAEVANRAKADFLASMSHELRTPLNAIGGYVDLIQMGIHGPVTDAQQTALSRVRASQQHLLSLINDVLSFARVEAGQIEIDVAPLAVRDLLAELEPLVHPLAESKDIALSVGCATGAWLRGDEERIRQILLNLVGNAIKFTPPGGAVTVTCHESGEWVELRVSDNGPGIPPEKHASIFDPFVQVDRRLSNPAEGVGLGLAISRDLAAAMGGTITVASEPASGSTFTLRLPAAEAPHA
jgi:PAS domain S-box-containing protein